MGVNAMHHFSFFFPASSAHSQTINHTDRRGPPRTLIQRARSPRDAIKVRRRRKEHARSQRRGRSEIFPPNVISPAGPTRPSRGDDQVISLQPGIMAPVGLCHAPLPHPTQHSFNASDIKSVNGRLSTPCTMRTVIKG